MRKIRTLALYLAPIPLVASAVLAMFVSGATPSRAAAHPAAAHALATHSAPRIHVRDGRHSTSTNWSGYASTGTTYNDVKGSWTQPTASCSSGQTAYSSFWVGIDGDTTNTVEQTAPTPIAPAARRRTTRGTRCIPSSRSISLLPCTQ
jgi:hypothetical protein